MPSAGGSSLLTNVVGTLLALFDSRRRRGSSGVRPRVLTGHTVRESHFFINVCFINRWTEAQSCGFHRREGGGIRISR